MVRCCIQIDFCISLAPSLLLNGASPPVILSVAPREVRLRVAERLAVLVLPQMGERTPLAGRTWGYLPGAQRPGGLPPTSSCGSHRDMLAAELVEEERREWELWSSWAAAAEPRGTRDAGVAKGLQPAAGSSYTLRKLPRLRAGAGAGSLTEMYAGLPTFSMGSTKS